ncbi:MAG TPA: hypothetical protein VGZ02_05820 [Candidatus Baltobacteraceae bacterium]|jgi:hypothetical protein|nr:hypothetical protein [Candidatus Baltobacteraceae bacterium]
MGPLPLPNFGALISAYKPNPLEQLAQAFGQGDQMRQQNQMNKLAMDSAKQQIAQGDQQTQINDFQLQSAKRQDAQQQWDQFGAMLKAKPQLAQDPNAVARATGLAEMLGLPSPLDANGHVDVSFWQTPWDSIDPTQQEKIRNDALQRDPGSARNAFFAGYSGVPEALLTAPKSYDAKDQAALSRARTAGLKESDDAGWLKVRAGYTKWLEDPTNPKNQEYGALAARYRADAQADVMKAQAAMTRAQAAMVSAQASWKRASIGGNYGMQVMRGTRAQITAARSVVDDQITVLQKSIQNLSATSNDPANDPQINALQQQLTGLQEKKLQLDQTYSDAVNYLTTNQGLVTSLQGQAGRQVQSVVNASHTKNKYIVGATYKMGDGSYVIYQGGDPNNPASWQTKQ